MSDDLTTHDLLLLLSEIKRLALSPHNRVSDPDASHLMLSLGQIAGIAIRAIHVANISPLPN